MFFYFFCAIHWSYEERKRRRERREEDGGEARGEGEGIWRVGGENTGKDRGEARGGYRRDRREDREEELEVTEEACKEDERCEEESECHSAARRARVCATFTDSQENAIVEFLKEHPELYGKEHGCFQYRQRKEALWAEISAELKLHPFDVRRWFESLRTRYGKLSKLQSGHTPREMTKRQFWIYQQMGFLKTHIRCKGTNRSSGFEASPNTSRHEESPGSTTDTEHLESSALRESRSQPMLTSAPVSKDFKILEYFDQMRTLTCSRSQTGSPSLTTWHQRLKR